MLLHQNAALFWYNYEATGTIDLNTLHAGCPVLLGEKWSKLCILKRFNKLIHYLIEIYIEILAIQFIYFRFI